SDKLSRIDAESPLIDSALWTTLTAQGRYGKKLRPEAELAELLRQKAEATAANSDDAKLLKTWFTRGESAFRDELAAAPNSRLYGFYRAELEAAQNGPFLSMAFTSGAWLPSGSLGALGNHPSVGFGIFGGSNRLSLGIIFDFRFASAASYYTF